MEQLLEKRYKSLEKLMGHLANNNLLDKNTRLNYSILLADIYQLNKLIYDSYLIFSSKLNNNEKIDKLMELRTRDGKKFIDKKMAKYVLQHYSKPINKFYGKFYKNKTFVASGGSMAKEVIDWVFFPLYKLEQLPLAGNFVGIPLDILGVVIDNTDIIMEFLGPFIPMALSLMADLGSALPIPGVNTGFAAASIATTLGAKPLEFILENGLDVISLFLNISRKQWSLAYLSAMEAVPNFPALMDATVTNLYTINKYVDKAKYLSELTLNNVSIVAPIAREILTDPSILVKPANFIQKIIIPNKQFIPILDRYPIESILPTISNIQDKVLHVYNNGIDTNNLTQQLYQQAVPYIQQNYMIPNNMNYNK